MSEPSDDIAVLQQHLGPQWPGAEADGHAAMVKVLQTARGYDNAQANAVITALVNTGKLCYHRLGLEERKARATDEVAIPFATKNIGGWYAERRRHTRNADQAGYWAIGHHSGGQLGRTGQVDPVD